MVKLTNNLRLLNASEKFVEIYSLNDVILLERLNKPEQSGTQTNWTSDLEKFHQINQVRGKLDFINRFRDLR